MENIKKYWILIAIIFVFFMYYEPVVCLIILGSFFLILGISSWTFLYEIKKRGIKSVGKILNYESDNDGHITPIVNYKTVNGKVINKKPYFYVTANIGSITTYKSKINEEVPIIYNPNNPEKFILQEEMTLNKFGLIFFIIVGLTLFVVGLLDLIGIININF